MVLAHGFGGSARNFGRQARALAEKHCVISYDARGHGRSEAPEGAEAYQPECLVSDFARILRGAGAPAVAGGLSLGAYTALAYALQAAEPPRGLILASYPGPRSNPARVRWAEGFADAIEARGLDSAGAEFVWGEGGRFDAQSAAAIRRGFLEHNPRALAAILRRVISKIPDPKELALELSGLPSKTLILIGSEDREARGPSEALLEHLPNAELVVLRGAGHLVNLQAPTEFNQAVSEFLARIDPRS